MSKTPESIPETARRNPSLPRWKAAVLLACAVIVAALIELGTVARVYATVVLPAPPESWNVTQLARIEREYSEQARKFYDTGNPEADDGFSVAVFGDIHDSRHTFLKLVRKVNQTNVKVEGKLEKLQAQLAETRKASGLSQDERDRSLLALKKKINETRKKRILFAVANGDLTVSGNEVQYRLFMERAKKLDVPFVTVPGNHDAKDTASDVYEKIFGPRYYSFSIGEDYFIMLDDSNQERIEPAQMEWFEGELVESEAYRYCTVFMHVPAFKGHRDETHKGVRIPWSEYLGDRRNAQEFKRLCEKYDVNFVVGSHLHTFDFDIWNMSGELDEDEAMRRNKDDEMVWTIISGGGGAQLWKTYDYRACYHYFVGLINGESRMPGSPGETYVGIRFDRIEVKSRHGERWYRLEEAFTYAFTDIVNNYFWGMLVLVPLFALLLLPFIRSSKTSS